MQVCVADIANIAHLNAVPRQLVFNHIVVELQTAHAQHLHDGIVAVAGIHHNRVLAAKDQKAIDWHAFGPSAVTSEHKEARFQLDITIVKQSDFKRHMLSP